MSDIDDLMTSGRLDLSDQEIEKIVAYHRAARARRAAGEKPAKVSGPTVDISSITKKLISDAKPKTNFTRRV